MIEFAVFGFVVRSDFRCVGDVDVLAILFKLISGISKIICLRLKLMVDFAVSPPGIQIDGRLRCQPACDLNRRLIGKVH
jgi:hypothetical protein